jgi:hypothetical protein
MSAADASHSPPSVASSGHVSAASVDPVLYAGRFHDGEEPTFDILIGQEEYDELPEEEKPHFFLLTSLGFSRAESPDMAWRFTKQRERLEEIQELTDLLAHTAVYTQQIEHAQRTLDALEKDLKELNTTLVVINERIVDALRRATA